jgi:chloride channel 3/4/5
MSPELPLEIVMQIFKRLGSVSQSVFIGAKADCFAYVRPRIILVEDHGVLSGLVTVKDVLKFIATEKVDHRPSWDERGGLDGLLEEIWTWASRQVSKVLHWSRRLLQVCLRR